MNNHVDYNLNKMVVSSNDLIKGRQFMSVREAGLIRLIIAQVAKDDEDYQTYSCRIKDLANFWGVSASNIYRDIKKICRSLMQQVVEIVDRGDSKIEKRRWKLLHWIETAQYDGEGNVTIRLSNDIKPYVLQLRAWFTQIQLRNIVGMKCFYSQRIYEILKCDLGICKTYDARCSYTVDELRDILCCKDKYLEFSNFKKQVIEKAVKEINAHTDLNVTPKYIKTGRSITSIMLIVKSKVPEFETSFAITTNDKFEIIKRLLKEKFKYDFSEKEKFILKRWVDDYSFDDDIILKACEVCLESIGRFDVNYVDGILKKWFARGYSTVDDIIEFANNVRKNYDSYQVSYNIEEYEKLSLFD